MTRTTVAPSDGGAGSALTSVQSLVVGPVGALTSGSGFLPFAGGAVASWPSVMGNRPSSSRIAARARSQDLVRPIASRFHAGAISMIACDTWSPSPASSLGSSSESPELSSVCARCLARTGRSARRRRIAAGFELDDRDRQQRGRQIERRAREAQELGHLLHRTARGLRQRPGRRSRGGSDAPQVHAGLRFGAAAQVEGQIQGRLVTGRAHIETERTAGDPAEAQAGGAGCLGAREVWDRLSPSEPPSKSARLPSPLLPTTRSVKPLPLKSPANPAVGRVAAGREGLGTRAGRSQAGDQRAVVRAGIERGQSRADR